MKKISRNKIMIDPIKKESLENLDGKDLDKYIRDNIKELNNKSKPPDSIKNGE